MNMILNLECFIVFNCLAFCHFPCAFPIPIGSDHQLVTSEEDPELQREPRQKQGRVDLQSCQQLDRGVSWLLLSADDL